MLRRCLAITLATAVLFSAFAQPRADTSTREALESEIASYEQLLEARSADIRGIEAELGETASALQARIAERDNVSAQISSLRAQRAELQAEIAQLEIDLVATGQEIERILGNLDSLLDRISMLLVNLYTQGSSRYAAILSAASSYHDFQVRSHYIELLTEQDVSLVQELNDTRQQLLEAQQRQSEQLTAQTAAEEQLRVNEEALVVQQNTLAGIIDELESTRAGQQAQQQALMQAQNDIEQALGNLAGQLQSEIARLQREEERLQREAALAYLEDLEKAEALQQQAVETRERIDNLTEPLLPTTSDYGFPVPNPTISSRYGFENNSYLALRANAANAAVTAIEAGVVSRVTLLSANDGYLVTVLHGNDLVVSYTNLQPPLVTVGQRVNKGHLLGYLGGGTLVPSDVLKLWVQVGNTFVDPQARLGF